MNFISLSKEINDVKKFDKFLTKSKLESVRPSSLRKNENYIIFIYNHVKTESPYIFVEYMGCGPSLSEIYQNNMKIVDMTKEYYWFKAYDIETNEFYFFGSHVNDNKLCVTKSSRRISFKKLVDNENNI